MAWFVATRHFSSPRPHSSGVAGAMVKLHIGTTPLFQLPLYIMMYIYIYTYIYHIHTIYIYIHTVYIYIHTVYIYIHTVYIYIHTVYIYIYILRNSQGDLISRILDLVTWQATFVEGWGCKNGFLVPQEYRRSLSGPWWKYLTEVYPIGSMYGIYANIGDILMVNVTIYSIHGSYGYRIFMNMI